MDFNHMELIDFQSLFIMMIDEGYIDIKAEPEKVDTNGNIEIFDGNSTSKKTYRFRYGSF